MRGLRDGGKLFFGFTFDVTDRVLHCGDLLGILIRDVDVESFFERHDEFDDVERIRSEVVHKRRRIIYLRFIDAELLYDYLLHLLRNGHGSSNVRLENPDSSILSVGITLKRAMFVLLLLVIASIA